MALGGYVIFRLGLGLWAVIPFQAVALLGPALLVFSGKVQWKQAVPFSSFPTAKAWPALLLVLGSSMAAIGVAMAESFFMAEGPAQRGLREGLAHYPLAARLALFALGPAILEEIFFRGMVLSCFKPWGRWLACLSSALLFAVFHLNPEQMAPVFVLGCALALVTWETGSLWPAVLGHAFHNSLILIALDFGQAGGASRPGSLAAAVFVIVAGAGLAFAGGKRLLAAGQEKGP